MIISKRKKFVFIHNPKTGGSSIFHHLRKYGYLFSSLPDKPRNYSKSILGESWKTGIFRKHIPARDLKSKLPTEVWDSYFKFGFVRNPYDRVVSLFNYVRQTPHHLEYQKFAKHKDLNSYLDETLKIDLQKEPWHCQAYYLADEDKSILVDFVGKFEYLHTDFTEISSRINVDGKDLQHKNKSNRERDLSKVFDNESIQKVNHIYALDFEIFKYKMLE